MGEFVDKHLLGFRAKKETLEQPCRIRVGCVLEYTALDDDKRRTFGRVHNFHRLALILEKYQVIVVAVSHDGAFAEHDLFRRISSRLYLHDFLPGQFFQIWPTQLAREQK